MKITKKFFCLWIFSLSLIGCIEKPQNIIFASTKQAEEKSEYYKNAPVSSIELSEENFPDEFFRTFLSRVIDKNSDGILTLSEREILTELRSNFYDENGEIYEPVNPDKKLMVQFVPLITDFTGIEYFPQLEKFYFHTSATEPENTYYFNFKYLSNLQSVEIKIDNPNALSYITFEDTTNLNEFWFSGNAAALQGLEQLNLQKFILNLGKQSMDIPFISKSSSKLTVDLTKFAALQEFHFRTEIKIKSYTFMNNSSLNTLAAVLPKGSAILRNMPNLQDVRILGATAIRSKNCPKVDCLRIGMEKAMKEPIKCLDLNSFRNLKVLQIAWDVIKIKTLLLPNDNIEIMNESGKTDTIILYQEQPRLSKMQQTIDNAFSNACHQPKIPVTYKSSSDSFYGTGTYRFVCTPGKGYRIDLNGDGIEEELYSDSEDFYLNGIGLNIPRMEYTQRGFPWETFWIFIPDENSSKYQLIINSAPLDRSYHSVNGQSEVPLQDYWEDGIIYNWKDKADFRHFIPNTYVGQYLLSYDGKLSLQAYAESDMYFYYFCTTLASSPIVDAWHPLKYFTFSYVKRKWVRVYGTTDEFPSRYYQDDSNDINYY